LSIQNRDSTRENDALNISNIRLNEQQSKYHPLIIYKFRSLSKLFYLDLNRIYRRNQGYYLLFVIIDSFTILFFLKLLLRSFLA